MPQLNWEIFNQLSGSTQKNFEMLCRMLIRCHYSQYGIFAARANQPGVEFHLQLNKKCSLGKSKRWYGWQCRWYDLPGGRSIGSARQKKIIHAIKITEKELPLLTDWVLWTKRPLSKSDQKWFYNISTDMELKLWTDAEVEEHLSGHAAIFRETYFGELILSPSILHDMHLYSAAQIKSRWVPDVHQIVDAERILRQMLGESEAWDSIKVIAKQLENIIINVKANINNLSHSLGDRLNEFINIIEKTKGELVKVSHLIEEGDIDLLQQNLKARIKSIDSEILVLPRKLRSINHRTSLWITNGISDLRKTIILFDDVVDFFKTQIIAVLAEAGAGKTQLSAELTLENSYRCSGILLFGKDFYANDDLNKYANKIVIPGKANPIQSIEALIAAVDAAGRRENRRLPIVIDGLNEAEDPRKWKDQIAQLQVILLRYPYVLVICTLRTGSRIASSQIQDYLNPDETSSKNTFVNECLPNDIKYIEIPDFGLDTIDAIRKYFHYYKINAIDADLTFELLSHPLTLRLFCEVTNPARKQEVGIEAMPNSLVALFEKYLSIAAHNIAQLSPSANPYCEQDIRAVYYEIGYALWENNARKLDENDFRKKIKDEIRPWNKSIICALEQEGIILRMPGHSPGSLHIVPIYDSLGGYFIANSILKKYGHDGFIEWLKKASTSAALLKAAHNSHPLANDIFRGLVGLLPRQFHREQLWQLLDEPLKSEALYCAIELEGSYLDADTINEISKLIIQHSDYKYDLFKRLIHKRSAHAHPLNAKFLDTVLKSMSIINRDIHWTEWIRYNSKGLIEDLDRIESQWHNKESRLPSDILRAEWIKWLLSSTIHILRDKATKALFEFGKGAPDILFKMTIDSLAINDPYIPERMLACSYGIAMLLHGDSTNQIFRNKILPDYALNLYISMFEVKAPYSTTHALMRDYSRHTIQLAMLHNPSLLNAEQYKRIIPPFQDCGMQNWKRYKGYGQNMEFSLEEPLRTDFANYTLSRLVPNRENYDFNNSQYIEVVENIYWRLNQLGYSPAVFEKIDKAISSEHWHNRSENNENRIDRYGKKYSWIAFYELYSFRYDKGLLKSNYYEREERPSDVDIDPSFPDKPHNLQVITKDWLGDKKLSLSSWAKQSKMPNIKPNILMKEIDGQPGPWVLLDGFIDQTNKKNKRSIYAFLRGLLITEKINNEFQQLLIKNQIWGHRLPDIPGDYYTFAGEIPWCDTFSNNRWDELTLNKSYSCKKILHEETKFYKRGKEMDVDETVEFLKKLQPILKTQKSNEVRALLKSEGVIYKKEKVWENQKVPVTKRIKILLPVRKSGVFLRN